MVYNKEAQNLYTINKAAVEGRQRGAAEMKPAGDINESAEAFIKRFRRQLLQQWRESMEKNYDQMIKRGVY